MRTSRGSSKAGGRNGEVHFLEVPHNISAYIIGQNWVTWPYPVAKKAHELFILVGHLPS